MAIIDPLFDPAVVEDPHGYYARLWADDPVHEVPGTGTFLVTRMDLIREVVADPAVFSSTSSEFLHHHANSGAPRLRGPGGSGETLRLLIDRPRAVELVEGSGWDVTEETSARDAARALVSPESGLPVDAINEHKTLVASVHS